MVFAKENVLSGKTSSNTRHPEDIEEVVVIADETVPAIANAADSNLEATAIDENQKEQENGESDEGESEVGGDSASAEISKKGKQKMFSYEETELLASEYVKNYDVIHNYLTGSGRCAEGKKVKDKILEELTAKCNEFKVDVRTPDKIQEKLRKMMSEMKKYSNSVMMERQKTGGGKVENIQVSPVIKFLYDQLGSKPRVGGIPGGVEVFEKIITEPNDEVSTFETIIPRRSFARRVETVSKAPATRRSSTPISVSNKPTREDVYELEILRCEAQIEESNARKRAAIAQKEAADEEIKYWKRKREREDSKRLDSSDPIGETGQFNASSRPSSSGSTHPILGSVRHFRDEPYELRNEFRGHPTARISHDDYEDLRGFAGNSHHRRDRDARDYRY